MWTIIAFIQKVVELVTRLVDAHMRAKDREAGRNDAILEQKEADNAVVETADAIRARNDAARAAGVRVETHRYRRD